MSFRLNKLVDYRTRCTTKGMEPPCDSFKNDINQANFRANFIQFGPDEKFVGDFSSGNNAILEFDPIPTQNNFLADAPYVDSFAGINDIIRFPEGAVYSIQATVIGQIKDSVGTVGKYDTKVKMIGFVVGTVLNATLFSSSEVVQSFDPAPTPTPLIQNVFTITNASAVGIDSSLTNFFSIQMLLFPDQTVAGAGPVYTATDYTVEIYKIGNL